MAVDEIYEKLIHRSLRLRLKSLLMRQSLRIAILLWRFRLLIKKQIRKAENDT